VDSVGNCTLDYVGQPCPYGQSASTVSNAASVPLPAGDYEIEETGCWLYNQSPPGDFANGVVVSVGAGLPQMMGNPNVSNSTCATLYGTPPTPGSCASDHVCISLAAPASVYFAILDTLCTDNSGALTMNIYAVAPFTPTPTPHSGPAQSVLAPVPAKRGSPVCLYSKEALSSSRWTVFAVDQQVVARLDFGPETPQCWTLPGNIAPGVYWVRLELAYASGGVETKVVKIAVTP
jgi:hypothetical protein